MRYDIEAHDLSKLTQLALRAVSYDAKHARMGVYIPEVELAVKWHNIVNPHQHIDIAQFKLNIFK